MAKKIFLIEDDENILYGLQDRFTSDGYDVDISNAEEELDTILARIREFKPAYLVLDLILPKHDGLEIVKRVKGDDELADVQVLVFTDLSNEDSRSRSVGLGVNYYFLKSDLDINEFADKVEGIISGEQIEEVAEMEDDEGGEDLVLE
ncbi:MAG: response regulator [Candidatus Falkowbacteria bacterium]